MSAADYNIADEGLLSQNSLNVTPPVNRQRPNNNNDDQFKLPLDDLIQLLIQDYGMNKIDATEYHDTLAQALDFISSVVLSEFHHVDENGEPIQKKTRLSLTTSDTTAKLTLSPLLCKILNHSIEFPDYFDDMLRSVARTSISYFPWVLLRFVVVLKTESVFSRNMLLGRQDISNNSAEEEFLQPLRAALGALWNVGLAPLGVRRVCELLLAPKKHYKEAEKLAYALIRSLTCLTIPLTHRVPDIVDQLLLPHSELFENPGPPIIPPPPFLDVNDEQSVLRRRRSSFTFQDLRKVRLSNQAATWNITSSGASTPMTMISDGEMKSSFLIHNEEFNNTQHKNHHENLSHRPPHKDLHLEDSSTTSTAVITASLASSVELNEDDYSTPPPNVKIYNNTLKQENPLASEFLKELINEDDDLDQMNHRSDTNDNNSIIHDKNNQNILNTKQDDHNNNNKGSQHNKKLFVEAIQQNKKDEEDTDYNQSSYSKALEELLTLIPPQHNNLLKDVVVHGENDTTTTTMADDNNSASSYTNKQSIPSTDLLSGAYFDEDDEDHNNVTETNAEAMELLSQSLGGHDQIDFLQQKNLKKL